MLNSDFFHQYCYFILQLGILKCLSCIYINPLSRSDKPYIET